ncbi:MAG: FAD-binding oxidoreductase [Acidimicrobiales bacterium]
MTQLSIAGRLEEVVGGGHVLTDPDVVASYVVDWTGRFRGYSPAVVRPGSVEEVAGVVATCAEHGVALTPQGGNTGLVGGSVPLEGEVVLSLTRLVSSSEVDAASGQITVGSGMTIGQLQRSVAPQWAYGVDLGSRDSATVGGTIGTNAGGLRLLRYGDTRAQVLGVEAVLGTGEVISHLGGLWKDNTGYDLSRLMCGSEGTLGIVTAARLRLVAPAHSRATVLLAFEDVELAVAAAASLRRSAGLLEAVEFFLQSGLELVCTSFALPLPFSQSHAAYVLAEAGGAADPTDELRAAVLALEGVADAALADSSQRRAALWRYREGHTEAISGLGVAHKLDVSVPLGRLGELVSRAPRLVEATAPGSSTWLFGHAADGNVHVNVTGVDGDDDRVDGAIFELVAELGGSISAEHGIGTAKKRWLHLNRSAAEIAAMRAVKAALDPAGILNPNVIF